MAELTIEASLLKNIIAAISDLNNNVYLNFMPKVGLSIESFSQDQLVTVSLYLKPENFDRFVCDDNISVGVNLLHLSHLLQVVDDDYVVTLKTDHSTNTVTILLKRESESSLLCFDVKIYGFLLSFLGSLKRSLFLLVHSGEIADHQMQLMDEKCEYLGIPKHDYDAVVKMPSAVFARICCHLSENLGLDNVVISVTNKSVMFFDEQGAKVAKAEEATITEMSKTVMLTFVLSYLKSFTKVTPLSKMVTISMSPGISALFEYKIEEMGYIKFYLPPVVYES